MDERSTRPRRRVYLIAGYLLFALGLLGAFLPILPTTIFWIGAAACFAQSSPQMYERILASPRFGPAVEDFLTRGAISRRSKVVALLGMAGGLGLASLTLNPGLPLLLAATVIGLAALYVVTRPTPD